MGPTVLLIEDNEQNRYLATFLLDAARLHGGVRAGWSAGIDRGAEPRART